MDKSQQALLVGKGRKPETRAPGSMREVSWQEQDTLRQGTRDDKRAELSMVQEWGVTQPEVGVFSAGQVVLGGGPRGPQGRTSGFH